jgi:tetratricopeptide (TPR) repeat protein
MTPHTPARTMPFRSDIVSTTNNTASRSGLGRKLAVVGALLVLAGAAGAWWWLHAPRLAPPMPADIQDAEVRQAIEAARQQVFSDPDSAQAWGHLGRVLLAHLFDRDADVCFAQAARLNPDDPMWFYGRGVIALKREPDKAIALLRQAAAGISRPEYRSVANLQLAEAFLERENLDDAEKLFGAELESEPDNARAALGLGLIAKVRGNEKGATAYLVIAQGSPHARKVATAQLAALARSRGDHAAAAAYDQETAGLPNDSAWPDPLLDGNLRLVVGRRGWERRMDQLEREGFYAEAVQQYLKKIEDEPTMQNYVGAGINLARLHEYDRALPLLRKALEVAPQSAHAHFSLGAVLCGRAEREWQATPGAEQVKQWFREAIDHSRRAADLRPDHARAYLHWGVALKYLGDPAAAIAPLKKGVACHPADSDLQLVLGEVLLETGNTQEAATHLENARRLAPNDPRPAKLLERLPGKVK